MSQSTSAPASLSLDESFKYRLLTREDSSYWERYAAQRTRDEKRSQALANSQSIYDTWNEDLSEQVQKGVAAVLGGTKLSGDGQKIVADGVVNLECSAEDDECGVSTFSSNFARVN